MSNALLTIDMITLECLRLAHEKSTFIGTCNRQFDDSFGRSDGKIGDTLRIRLPSQYQRRKGSRVMDVQDAVEQKTQLVVATQDGVDMRFNSRELKMDLQNFSKVHLEPAMAVMISGIESDFLQGVTKQVWNTAGIPGTVINDLLATGNARAKMNQNLAPKDGNRNVQVDSVTSATMVNALKGLFQDSSQIKDQYREGMLGRTAMADFYENERTWAMSNASNVTGQTLNSVTLANGTTQLAVSGGTVTPTVGQVFTIAGLFSVHPETKAAFSNLQQFVVGAGSTSSVLQISPTIYISGAQQNVATSAGAVITPANFLTAALTYWGSASTSYQQNLMYHKDAFTFATADLPLMKSSEMCVIKQYDGLSIRVWQDSDIRNDELLTRIDMLYGYAAIRPQWACRISN